MNWWMPRSAIQRTARCRKPRFAQAASRISGTSSRMRSTASRSGWKFGGAAEVASQYIRAGLGLRGIHAGRSPAHLASCTPPGMVCIGAVGSDACE